MLTWDMLSTPTTPEQAVVMAMNYLSGQGFTADGWQPGSPPPSGTAWESGSIQLTFVMLFAWLYSSLTYMIAALLKGQYNETAEFEFLKRYSESNYDNTHDVAVTAQHRIEFTCTGSAGPYSPTTGQIVVGDGTQTFRLIATDAYPLITIPAGGSAVMLCEAEVAGAAGNAANGTITRMVSTVVGVTCNNPPYGTPQRSIVRYGVDLELDPRLRTRNRTKWATLSVENVKDAVVQLALSPVNGLPSGISKVGIDDTNPRGVGTVDAWIAGATTALTESGAEQVAFQAKLDDRFMGNGATVKRALARCATPQPFAPVGTIYYSPNFDVNVVMTNVQANVDALLAEVPLGGSDYYPGPQHALARNDVVAAIETAAGVKVGSLPTLAETTAVAPWSVLVPNYSGLVYVATAQS